MAQSLQDWYLANLGIVKYVPRDQPVLTAEEVPAPAHSISNNAVLKDLSLKDALLQDVSLNDSSPVKEKPSLDRVDVCSDEARKDESIHRDQASQAATSVARFSYATWHPVDDLLVVTDLVEEQNASVEQSQLLLNILRSINRLPETGAGLKPEALKPEALKPEALKPEVLKWPERADDQSEAGARSMLATFFSARIKKRGVCWVLLMGEGTLRYLDGEIDEEHQFQMPGGATGLCMPSLAQMLSDSSFKRQAWQVLKPLAGSD